MRDRPDDAARPLVPWALAALAALVYLNTLRGGFVYDDVHAVGEHPAVAGRLTLEALFGRDYWGGARSLGWWIGSYRPLTTLTYALDWRLGGGRPWAFHLTNALLHALTTGALHRVLRARISEVAALAAAAVFAVHPLHAENVASIVGRGDVLSLACLLLAWEAHARPSARSTARAPALFLAGLLAKESAVVLVPLLALHDLGGTAVPRRHLAARYALYAAALGLMALARLRLFGTLRGFPVSPLTNPLLGAPWLAQTVTAVRLLGRAVELLIAPVDLIPDYGVAVIDTSASLDARVALGAVTLAGLLAVAWRCFRRRHALTEAAAWFLLPAPSLVNALFFVAAAPVLFAERLLYLPSVGAFALAGEGVAWAWSRWPRRAAAATLAYLAVLAAMTVARNAEWATDASLFAAAVAVEPRSARAQQNLGEVRFRQGRYAEAFRHCTAAAVLAPYWARPHGCRGSLLAIRGRDAEAEAAFLMMLRGREPDLENLLNYVRFLRSHGRHAEALAQLRRARRLGPTSPAVAALERFEHAQLAAHPE